LLNTRLEIAESPKLAGAALGVNAVPPPSAYTYTAWVGKKVRKCHLYPQTPVLLTISICSFHYKSTSAWKL